MSQEDTGTRALAARFGLDATEAALLALVAAGPVTVAAAREQLGDGAYAALARDGRLRRHALVDADGEGWPDAAAPLRLGAGVAARLAGAARAEALAPGVRLVGPVVDGTAWVQELPPSARAAELVKEEIAGAPAELFTVDGCARREALGLAVGLARRMKRGVLAVDAAALREPWRTLAAARREADLEGWVLLVYEARAAGEAWRAAAGGAAAGAAAPTVVLLCDGGRAPEVVVGEGLRARALVLYAPAAASAAATAAAAATGEKDDAYEQIRQLAARDADRALGISRPVSAPKPAPPAPAPAPAAVVAAQPAAAVATAAVQAPAVAETHTAAATATVAATSTAAAAETAKVAAPAVEAVPAADPPKRKRSRKAIEHFGDPDAPKEAKAEPPKAEPPKVEAPAAAAEAAAAGGGDAPPLEIPEAATPDQLARIASTSPNAAQRIELMNQLAGHKSAAVVASLRANAQSANPTVRAAAETVMQAMFGANWNKFRPVPKPVQPPRTDDKDRGPPGGW